MNSLILLAATTEPGNPVQEIARTFGWEPRLFLSQVALIIILAIVLKKFAYGPVIQMLAERRKRIEEGLANADKIKAELARAEAERQQILAKANDQANKLIEEARAAAAKVQEQETQKAIQQAEQIMAKAREAAAADHARMLADLKREVGRLVVETTSRVTGKVLTADDQKRLAEETSKQLAA
jgi:F-type H+-transporting ATPase subunit b